METKKLIKNLENRISNLETENKRLHETVDFLTKKLYGRSSEKTSALMDQMSIFDEAEVEADPNAPEPDIEQARNYMVKRYPGKRVELLKDLPRTKKLLSLNEEDRICIECGDNLVPVGEEFVRTEIEFIPAKVHVIDYYRETFECRTCRKNGYPYMEKAPMPDSVIQHSMASPSTIAWIMHQKFVNAIPLYRQEKEWKSLGVQLGRSTMANWLIVSSRDWLIPLVELMHKKLLAESHLHIDETTVQVLKEENRKNTTKSYMWIYGTGKSSSIPIRIFDYQPGRSGKYPTKFLKEFEGYIHTDAFSGYNKVPGVTRCLCWAHLRRKFVDAIPKDLKDPNSDIASKGIKFCNQLFEIEKEIEEMKLKPDKIKVKRLELEKTVLDAFWSWVESMLSSKNRRILPKGKLSTALNYAMNNREGFMNYLLDGNCVISNNLAENSIRPFTIGRKNWLFSGSPRGAKTSAAIYSLIETAKANGLSTYKYLNHILTELPGLAPEFFEEYLPWDEHIQKICK